MAEMFIFCFSAEDSLFCSLFFLGRDKSWITTRFLMESVTGLGAAVSVDGEFL